MVFKHGPTKSAPRARGGLVTHTVLGQDTRWQGDLHVGVEGLRIEGTLEGTILSEGDVEVAPTGLVKGILQVKNLSVNGRVEGVVRVKECLEIQAAGWVEGEMEFGTLVVDEGGTLQGTCMPRSAGSEPQEPEPIHPRRDERFPDRGFLGAGPQADPAPPARISEKPRF